MPHMPDIKRFPCPHCGAKQGESCRLPNGRIANVSHSARKYEARQLVSIAVNDQNDGRSRYV